MRRPPPVPNLMALLRKLAAARTLKEALLRSTHA
jgi:hypothetical protein